MLRTHLPVSLCPSAPSCFPPLTPVLYIAASHKDLTKAPLPKDVPPCSLSCPWAQAGTWFKSRSLQLSVLQPLMPSVFHKGWGDFREGEGLGKRGLRLRVLKLHFFPLASFFFFLRPALPTSDVTLNAGKKTKRRITRLPY